ncbi:MAG TPA: DnaJ domain-containing protein [Clostridia bacterium]|nr:DnaJ domain-containing protein [Clostridia bacterium]
MKMAGGAMAKNLYEVLGTRMDATPVEIKAAFRERAMALHPDRSGAESGPFREAREAYEVLSDPERRRAYDRELRQYQAPAWIAPQEVEHFAAPGYRPRRNTAEPFRAPERKSQDELLRRAMFARLWRLFDEF